MQHYRLIIPTLTGSIVGFIGSQVDAASYGESFTDYVFKPLYWVVVFCIFPALGLGVLFSSLMEKAIGRVEAQGDA